MIAGRVMLGAVPVMLLRPSGAVGLAKRDRRNAEQRALHGAGDGAGIGHVLGDVLAAVDAGQDEVRPRSVQDVAHAHDDAVGRRAAHGEVPRRRSRAAAADRSATANARRRTGRSPARPPRRRPTIARAIVSSTARPGAWMPSSLVTRMRMVRPAVSMRVEPAHVGLQRFRHRDAAVLVLVVLHHRDQRAADRDARAVERVDEARCPCRRSAR